MDTQYPKVTAWRCECKQCGHVFRVYPKGVSQKQISKRVNGMAVMLSRLGLSDGAVEIMLHSLGIGIGKTSVYRAVQFVAARVPGLKRENLLSGYQTKAAGADITSVRCNGKWVTIGVVVDAVNGMVVRSDELPGQNAKQLQAWLEPILDAVGAEVVVSLALLKEMIHSRRPQDQQRLENMYLRYANARKPSRGKKHEVAYRMRNLFMDCWNLWPRLMFYRTWQDEYGSEILDGTNNHCERAIGWWIKERYHSMRGYKQERSALGMSRLIAFGGNNLSRGLNLAGLMA